MYITKVKKLLSTGYWCDFYIYPLAAIIFLIYCAKLLYFNLKRIIVLFLIGIILGSFLE
ncbi:fatty acid hydroxylase family protein, partial [Francisella tularensis subsp. holarctica]|nr:fatty acid hydroxylase family protein [Francisella tularensis subsp. holarctica]